MTDAPDSPANKPDEALAAVPGAGSTATASGAGSGAEARPLTSSAAATGSVLGLRDSDRSVLTLIAGVGLLLTAATLWGQGRSGSETIHIDRPPDQAAAFQIDVNSATWVEWMQLEGIGENMARQIVANREERGPFQSVDDVDRVPRIGKVTLDKIRPHLKCASCPD